MNIKKLMALPAVPLLAISMAACGNDSDAEVTTTQAEVTTEAPTTAESTEPAVVETTTEPETTVEDDAKPSKEEVATGMQTYLSPMLEEQYGPEISAILTDDFYTCLVDEVYDDFSAEALRAIAEGDTEAAVFTDDDLDKTEEASANCAEQAITN